MGMAFKIDRQPTYTVFELMEENLNSQIAPELKSKFVVLYQEEGTQNLILSLANVKYVDSSGLSAILSARRIYSSEGCQFVLTNVVHPSVIKLIKIVKIETVVKILPTLEESIAFIKANLEEDDDDVIETTDGVADSDS